MILSCSVLDLCPTYCFGQCLQVSTLTTFSDLQFISWVIWYVFFVCVLVMVFDLVIDRHSLQFVNIRGDVFLSNVGTSVFIGALCCSLVCAVWLGILDLTNLELIVLFFL